MLKSIYHKADETTAQKTYASVQQSLAAMNTHLGPTLNTGADHPDNREVAETSPRPGDGNLEEVSIHFLRPYSVHPDWKQIISSCNDYGQTMAHISVTLGYSQLLRHLFTWEIDLNVMDNVGLTALHYAYIFQQEDCAKFLVQSGVNQFILDDLGRSPSDLDPSLEVRLHPVMDIKSDSHADGASPIEYDTEMPDKVANNFLAQHWTRRDEDEIKEEVHSTDERECNAKYDPVPSLDARVPEENSTVIVKEEMDWKASIEIVAPHILHPPRDEDERRGEAPPSRYQSPKNLGHPRTASSPRVLDSADERERGATYDRFPSLGVRIPEENSTLVVAEEMDWKASNEIVAPPHIHHPPSPISQASAQSQEAHPPSDSMWTHATTAGNIQQYNGSTGPVFFIFPTASPVLQNQNTPQETWTADRKMWKAYYKMDWFMNQQLEPDLPHVGRSIFLQWLNEVGEGNSWVCRVPLDVELGWCDHRPFNRLDRAIAHVRKHLDFKPFACEELCGNEGWYVPDFPGNATFVS